MSKVEADGAGEIMTEQNALPGSNAEPPKKKGLDLSIFLKPVTEMDSSVGKLFLFPLRASDFGEYEKLSAQASVERIKEFLPCIASLSPDYSLDQKRVAITAVQVERLSDQEVEALAEAYASSSSALREARDGGKNRESLAREPEESATAFLDRLLSKEMKERANELCKQREQLLGSTGGVFDQVRKSSLELGETWRQFERLTKASAVPKDNTQVFETKSLEFSNHMAEHSARLARERAEDREMIRLTGQMSAQSAKTLQELADAASTMLENFDRRDEEAKRTTKVQLWIAVGSVVVSAVLALLVAGAAYYQDRDNIAAGDKWQAEVLGEMKASNKHGASLETENQLLRDRVEQLSSTVTALKNKASANSQESGNTVVDQKKR